MKQTLICYHTVASYELDAFGHVNNAVFLNYLEKARCDFMAQRGLRFYDFFQWKRYPVIIRASLEYKWPARADDQLVIKAWISKHRPTGFTMKYEITNPSSHRTILDAETDLVFVDENNRPTRIPPQFASRFIDQNHPNEPG